MPVSTQAYHTTIGSTMRTKSKPVIQKPPADFDEVKRRFIRQNRELAKNNSNQSLRIRSLEIEVSRLSSNNFELREQVLQLQHEVHLARTQASTVAVRTFKEEMQAKLAELSGIVNGIEEPQDDVAERRKRKSLPQMEFRERQPLTELMREGQMPTIVEDKQFPRKTLDAQEIKAIRLSDHSSNESPDLGPPPVAHFDTEDPIEFHAQAARSPAKAAEDDALPASLSVNLETRRKRKDGQPKLEIRRRSMLPQSPGKADGELAPSLRTGAKRKLADRELDKPMKPPSRGDFTFSRKGAAEEKKVAVEDVSLRAEPTETLPVERDAAIVAPSPKPARKVLGEKSVNQSPRKALIAAEKFNQDDLKKPAGPRFEPSKERKGPGRPRISAIPPPPPPVKEIAIDTVELPPSEPLVMPDVPPKTPAAPDLFSPTPSEQSARPNESRDTPPPGDLSGMSNTSEASRTSRRARGAVNYAEPSLNAKMRRPSKQMVDAIGGLRDPRLVMSRPSERKTARAVSIKPEPEDDNDAWKSLPSATEAMPGSPSPQRGDTEGGAVVQESSLQDVQLAPHEQPSVSSAAIASLIAGSRKRRTPSQQQQLDEQLSTDIVAATQKLEELDLYEFKDTSSPSSTSSATMAPIKSHRRSSSVPKKDPLPVTDADTITVARPGLTFQRSERAASRRRSMML